MEKIKLELSLDEVNIVIKGLSKLPLEESLSTFAKIKENAEVQLKKYSEKQGVDKENS